jgi:hypothetical protein
MNSLSYSAALRLTNTLMMVSSILSVFGVVSLKLGLVDYKSPSSLTSTKQEREIENSVPLFASFASSQVADNREFYTWNLMGDIPKTAKEIKLISKAPTVKTTPSSSNIAIPATTTASSGKEFSISSVTTFEENNFAVLSSKGHGFNPASFIGN